MLIPPSKLLAKLTTSRPKNVMGPTRVVDMETRIETIKRVSLQSNHKSHLG